MTGVWHLYASAAVLLALIGLTVRDAVYKPVCLPVPSGAIKRNALLDVTKGVAIINIVFIHSVWWSGQTYMPHDVIRQLALIIDVPLFFFISGFATSSARITAGRLVRRFLRLYIPLVVLILFLSVVSWQWNGITVTTAVFFQWLTLHIDGTAAVYPAWACVINSLWFLQVYFIIFLLSPVLHALLSREFIRYVVLAVLILLIALFTFYPLFLGAYPLLGWIPVRYVIFYAAFYALGFMSKDTTVRPLVFLFVLAGELTAVGCCLALQQFTFDLQSSKFPPGLLYFFVSLVPVTLILYLNTFHSGLGESSSGRRVFSFLKSCGVNVYSIYLYQGFGAMLGFPLAGLLAAYEWGVVLTAVFLANLAVSLMLGFLFRTITAPLLERLDTRVMRLLA